MIQIISSILEPSPCFNEVTSLFSRGNLTLYLPPLPCPLLHTHLLATTGVTQQSLLLAVAYQLDAGRIRHILHGQIGHLLQYAGIGPAGHYLGEGIV